MATGRLADLLESPRLEKPIKLSWSFGEPVIACSVPREAMVKYAQVLQSMRFKPGKKKDDHCWYIKNSERFRHSQAYVKAVADKLRAAGAEVEIEYEGSRLEEIVNEHREIKMKFSKEKLEQIIKEEHAKIHGKKDKRMTEAGIRRMIRRELSEMHGVDPFGMPGEEGMLGLGGEEEMSPCAAKAAQQDRHGALANPAQSHLSVDMEEPAAPMMSLKTAYPGMEFEEAVPEEEEDDMLFGLDY